MESLVTHFRQLKTSGQKISSLTAYDYPTARLVDEAGVDLILVGDSLGMVVLGYPDTTAVTLDDMIRHTGAVARGVKHTPVITDLPIHTYDTPEQALVSARLVIEAGAHGVKIEGGESVLPQMKALTAAGIPVLAHLGMLPQQIHEEGGYKVKGRSAREADQLLRDAAAVQDAGAFAVVLEIVTQELASLISAGLQIPTIGIGSGDGCDGQILVLHDLIGLYPWFRPKFVTPRADLAAALSQAVREYTQGIRGNLGMTPP
jgi:3-methyl-2-oxobutanoate hydroxymethyltransferase